MTVTPNREGHLLLIPEKLGGGNFTKLSAFPGYSKWLDRSLIIRSTGANLAYLLERWPDAAWVGGAEDVRDAYLAEEARAEEVRELKHASRPLYDDGSYVYKREPMEHQRKAFLLSRDLPAFGLFMEQGTGKTKVILDTASYLFQQDKIDALIIVAWPNGVHRNWIDYELGEDMSVPYFAEYWGANNQAKHRRVAFRKLQLRPRAAGLKVMAFNVECFLSEPAKELILELLGNFRCLFVIDQSASIKNPEAKRTKFLVGKCSTLAPYRRVLDGAPVAEGADELYSQFKFLDPNIIGHDTWTAFKAEYCEIGYFKQIKGYKNLPKLRSRIDPYCYRVLADDCLDLPERVYKRWSFDLAPGEQRVFDELKLLSLASFSDLQLNEEDREDVDLDFESDDILTTSLALVKNLRLQQISSGWWPKGERRSIEARPTRLDALLTLLDAATGKALIFSRFRGDLELMAEVLGKKAVSYHGGVSPDDRAEAKRRFMNDPKVLYFVGQPRSAGIGHTLTAARHVIFYSNDPSLRLREECEKRAHRQGLKHKLIVWDLIARGSHDIAVVRSLRAKKELANVIMEDPDNFFLQHED